MKRFILKKSIFILSLLSAPVAQSNILSDPVLPISHCYHWLSPEYLQQKLQHAKNNKGELSFYTRNADNNKAGDGLYCAKSPAESHTYGSRLIRIDFVDDIVVLDDRKASNVCGHRGDALDATECRGRQPDMRLYDPTSEWFVIKNPAAVARWSAASLELIADLEAEKQAVRDGYFQFKADATIREIKIEIASHGEMIFHNGKARLGASDFLVRDANRVQAMRPGQLLTALALLPPGRAPADRIDWARRIGIERLAKDTTTSWADIRMAFEKDPATRSAVIAIFPQLLANSSNVATAAQWDLLMNIVLITGEEVGRANVRQLAAALAKNPVSTKLWDQKVILRGPLADEVKLLLLEWADRTNPADSLKELILLQQYAKNFIDLPTANRLLEVARRALPRSMEDGFELSWDGKSVPVGTPEILAKTCVAQALLNNLQTTAMLSFDGHRLLQLDFKAGSSNQSVCEIGALFAKQYAAVRKTKDTYVNIVTLTFDRTNVFRIPVDDPATLEKFVDELTQIQKLAASREIWMALNGGDNKNVFFSKFSPRNIALFSRCLGLRSATERAYDETIKNRPDAFPVNISLQTENGGMTCFDMAPNNIEETTSQCEAAVKAYVADPILSAGFTMKDVKQQFYINESARTPSDPAQVCAKIREKLASQIPTASAAEQLRKASVKFRFLAYIDGGVAVITGNHAGEIQAQCLNSVAKLKHSQIEGFSIREWSRFESLWIYRDRDNWQTTANFCSALVKRVVAEYSVPSAAQHAVLQLNKKYRADVTMGSQMMLLIFDSKQEMYNQCLSMAVNEEVNRIRLSINQNLDYIDHPNSFWRTKQETCLALFQKAKLP